MPFVLAALALVCVARAVPGVNLLRLPRALGQCRSDLLDVLGRSGASLSDFNLPDRFSER
jgi:hypothetical protein